VSSFITHLEKDFLEQLNDTSPDDIINQFQNFVIQSAKEITEHQVKNGPDLFSCSEAKLLHHINSGTKPSRITSAKGIKPP